ncbi:hypothetical protein BDV95DRAFT_490229 [Massariosphaeria phaeospora]|uniref:Rhodopsin domain-containing protein n=1 Tax=Massariosphaeria phaeospora TaxID=100035 RepID=A0A7C8MA08_9PLEO|nr:hypothetical protein BDV95DRAFT_490229 [Massariosphaeria phaeospora]
MVESRQAAVLAVICLFPALAALFVAARIFSRQLGRNYGLDDGLIYIALVLLLGETVTMYQFVILGHTGHHIGDVPKQTPEQQVLTLKWSFAVQLIYHPMMGAIRQSIIMFLYRVKDKRPLIRHSLHVVFWVNIGYMISTTAVNIFQCDPIRYAYMRPQMDQIDADGKVVKGGKCINSLAFIMASCALSIFMDLIIIPIPTAMVWNLQMQFKTKAAVVIIMSMGWIATAVSVGRLIIYYGRFSPSNVDKTWNIGLVISIVEPSVGIIAACAPAMKCLIRNLAPRYFSEDSSDHSRSPTEDKSRTRPSFIYPYDMGNENGSERLEAGREEGYYDVVSLGSIDSREQMPSAVEHAHMQAHSVKTGNTAYSEPIEAVPQHFLSHAY